MIPLTPFKGRRIGVLGLGKSGVATARAAVAGGAEVIAWDDDPARRAALPEASILDLAALDWRRADLLSPAPGVPLTHPAPHPAIVAAQAAGATVIGDIDLYQRCCPDAVLVGVTGTNGKSTTTALIAHMLTRCGAEARVAGNIGQPVLALEPPAAGAVQVLELSSYQLDLTREFHPRVAVFLNLTPDHLDRHGDMAGYLAAKERLFANMGGADVCIIGIDDAHGAGLAKRLSGRGLNVVPVSVGQRLDKGVCVYDGQLLEDGRAVASLSNLAELDGLPGRHNHQNAAAAWAACRALGQDAGPELAAAMADFSGLAHRMERIGSVAGVTFCNDSKATNGEAAARALDVFERIYWIAGGRAKDDGLTAALPHIAHVRRAYLIGEAAAGFARELAGRAPVRRCDDLAGAVETAFTDARRDGGGTVLLSPACASFDQFRDFEARGDAFRDLAAAIIAREGGAS